ncbi:DUF1906 domain-containing protein [Streptomyces sp. N2-109]|uniref:DUF1906 domain-containing protein n=1 Tax=Streptomyces gossypii TaxID=2883101 RepID=A0ABT2JNI6_9ACTN|nr:glycoside hydrolase domain-containing protein [Streptomyces gossypii]MCT2589381.1 DUF1906 domain-containing protein [Streptomyces gossypii]
MRQTSHHMRGAADQKQCDGAGPRRASVRRAGVLLVALASLLAGGTAPVLAEAGTAPGPEPERGAQAYAPRYIQAQADAHGEDPRDEGAEIFQGRAFDTCVAPTQSTMRAWRASPYRGVGVYVGGRGRACPVQPNLDPAWVEGVTSMGWRLLPLYVGSQAPCVHAERKRRYAIDSRDPAGAGVREGRDAVAQARALGMREKSPVYLDMEAYDIRDAACARTTLRFIQGWNREVRRLGYLPGFYSSATSGVTHLEEARAAGVQDLPAVMWFARWNTAPDLRGEPALAPGAWQPHRRVHQYRGNVRETYGGRTVQIDRNLVDAPVAIVG